MISITKCCSVQFYSSANFSPVEALSYSSMFNSNPSRNTRMTTTPNKVELNSKLRPSCHPLQIHRGSTQEPQKSFAWFTPSWWFELHPRLRVHVPEALQVGQGSQIDMVLTRANFKSKKGVPCQLSVVYASHLNPKLVHCMVQLERDWSCGSSWRTHSN